MHSRWTHALILTIIAMLSALPSEASDRILPDFQWADIDGNAYQLSEVLADPDTKIVVFAFSGIGCPLVNVYAPKLEKYAKDYAPNGVRFFWVNSNSQDTVEELRAETKKFGITFPAIKDEGNKIADLLGAERTTEVFVIDQKQAIRYQGRIDTQYGIGWKQNEASEEYLLDAVSAVIQGDPVRVAKTESPGCIIGRTFLDIESEEVTYSDQVSRIFQRNCVTCHRPGEIGPFSLLDYDSAKGWARMIREVVNQKRMPPWLADPHHGTFVNDRRMSNVEIALINKWVENGAPEGDPAKLPKAVDFVEGWGIGDPDVVYEMPAECHVPAGGSLPYQYFAVKTKFDEDRWIKAAEVRAGNPSVVHHILIFIKYPKGHEKEEPDFEGGLDGYFLSMVPGETPSVYEDGFGKLLPAGSVLVFQVHYTPNGRVEKDRSKIGLVFADKPVKKEVITRGIYNTDIKIPAHAENHLETAKFEFKDDSYLTQMLPHMHLRGKSFTYTAKYPDGSEEILLSVPQWDFNWQNGYRLAEPKFMPKGTKILCEAVYDNSENNPANPNPDKRIRFGEQTWDEMLIGYIDYYLADQDLTMADSGE
ncbi:MAG: redoxin family protein [Candidatus Omnitrophica bacterium]|nr:redoxin family protein [Candidatus Omnitrophota bacterium]